MPCCKDYVIRKPWIRYTDVVGFIYLLHSVPFDQTGRVHDALLKFVRLRAVRLQFVRLQAVAAAKTRSLQPRENR